MALTAGQQLCGSAVCSLDLQDSLHCHERVSYVLRHDRIICLMQKQPPAKKGRSRPSSTSSSPSLLSSSPASTSSSPPSTSFKALKESLVASALSAYEKGHVLLERDPETVSTMQSSSPPSTSFKALKESLVASALSAYEKGHALLERDPETVSTMQSWPEIEGLLTELRRSLLETQWALTCDPDFRVLDVEEEEENKVVKSGRPSARQRRLCSRKPKIFDISGVYSVSSEKKTQIEKALAVVNTIGLKGRRDLLTKEEEVILSKKMKVGYNLRAARVKLAKVLGHEPSDELWASSVNLTFSEVQGKILEADRARDQMFVSNLRLVFSVANKYGGLGVTLSDLIQEGALGLLRGLEKFNHKKGFKLSTYVHWWVRQGITRALADHSRTVRLPAHMHERLNAINKAAASLRLDGMSVSVKRLSQAVNMPDEMVTAALKSTKKMVSLDKAKRWGQFGAEEETMHNYIADPRPESDPWIAVDKISVREDVDYLLKKILNKREREIVRLHYGLDRADGLGLSLEKISHRYGISRERTRQVEGCALRKLAATARSMDLDIPVSGV